MIFTPKQIEILLRIVKKYQTIFIAKHVGIDNISKIDKAFLKSFGIDINKISKGLSKIEQAYYFGLLSRNLGNKDTKNLTFKQFVDYFNKTKHIPLSEGQEAALDFLKTRAYTDITGLGNKIQTNLSNILLSGGKKEEERVRKLIKNKSLEAIRESKSVGWLASELRNGSKDWARDFDRISDYIMHEAYDTGRAQEILTKYGEEAIVFKDVYPGACKYCISLYLTNGIGSKPIEYKLIDLIANGTNIGVKAENYKPVIGPLHPYCRCTMNHVPINSKWDPKINSYTVIRNTYGVKRTSRLKIAVNGKEID